VFSALRAGELADGGDTSSSDDIRRALARDRVAQTLTTMLLNLENFKTDQVGNPRVLPEITDLQESTRDALRNLRHVLYDLRGPTGMREPASILGGRVEVEGALGRGTTARGIHPRKQLL